MCAFLPTQATEAPFFQVENKKNKGNDDNDDGNDIEGRDPVTAKNHNDIKQQ
jgi:hypothetical protein